MTNIGNQNHRLHGREYFLPTWVDENGVKWVRCAYLESCHGVSGRLYRVNPNTSNIDIDIWRNQS